MKFFDKLLGRPNSSSDPPPEVVRIFEKISHILDDENTQNSMYPPEIKGQIISGSSTDEIANSRGEFGRSVQNPIPVNGPIGELVYLSCLKNEYNGQRLLFHRLGSIGKIDVYETVTIDGASWDLFFFSMYHPRKSRKAPRGFAIADSKSQPLLYGTNRFLEQFPYGLQQAIRDTTEGILGIPMPPQQVRQAEETIIFRRPNLHEGQIKALDLDGRLLEK
jgi:hypothetical protein